MLITWLNPIVYRNITAIYQNRESQSLKSLICLSYIISKQCSHGSTHYGGCHFQTLLISMKDRFPLTITFPNVDKILIKAILFSLSSYNINIRYIRDTNDENIVRKPFLRLLMAYSITTLSLVFRRIFISDISTLTKHQKVINLIFLFSLLFDELSWPS